MVRNDRPPIAGVLVLATFFGTASCAREVAPDAVRRQGKLLFEAQGCVVCHGQEGHGDGPKSRSLNPRPRDFRERDAYLQGTRAGDIAATVKTGIVVHSAQMPTFAHLTEAERLALGEFVVSLQH